MHDVARVAGVSIKTVSRVVNGEPGVRASTRERVDAAIGQLRFLRNDGASQLRSGRADTIGLIVEDLANPFYSVLAAAVERVTRRHGHLLMTGSGEGLSEQEQSLAAAFLSRRAAGLLVVPTESDHAWLTQEATAGTPLVFLDRPAAGIVADTFLTDNEGGVRSGVEHLAAHGHRHIAFLGDDPAFWTAARRLDGFHTATTALGLRCDRVAMGPHDPAGLVSVLRAWTQGDDPITAILTGNNIVTVAALHAMRAADVRLGLVGFDDFELADLLEPSVTVIAQDPASMGEQAAHMLFQRLAGDTTPPRTVIQATRLVVRESGRLR
ncbi:LacI family transcriptional regulator [Nocardioides gansuensis]|uniref:LacI family transcriptional regulator n=2 Tax=Nocardioides gansuensis TaxID=2138300 RepID=A0A2T8F7C1_9ACTN|nr:LacI family transcriptional regulator [Nocardioides gansuensis]